jgi:hypothetical protein
MNVDCRVNFAAIAGTFRFMPHNLYYYLFVAVLFITL